jgi:hypothetical protein
MKVLRRASVIALSLLAAGCAMAFEYPTEQAWGRLVEEEPGQPVFRWNSQVACESSRLGTCRPMTVPSGQVWMLSHWDRPSRSIYVYASREACESPKWTQLHVSDCVPMVLEAGGPFWVFSQVGWRTDWSGGARWVGSDSREVCKEWRYYIAQQRQPTSDCVQVRVK